MNKEKLKELKSKLMAATVFVGDWRVQSVIIDILEATLEEETKPTATEWMKEQEKENNRERVKKLVTRLREDIIELDGELPKYVL